MNMGLLLRFTIASENVLFVFTSAAVFPDIFTITNHKTPDNQRVQRMAKSHL